MRENNTVNRRKALKVLSAAGSAAFVGSAFSGSAAASDDADVYGGAFKKKSDAVADVQAASESDALSDLFNRISETTGHVPDTPLPLSHKLETGDENLQEHNPAITPVALKKPTQSWEDADPSDVGMVLSLTRDGKEAGNDRVASIGVGVVPNPSQNDPENTVSVEYFGFKDGSAKHIKTAIKQSAVPDRQARVSSIHQNGDSLPDGVSSEVLGSYQSSTSGKITTQGIAGSIGCSTCLALIPALCAGTNYLGEEGCLAECATLIFEFPVLAGACGAFCTYVTTLEGVTLCASAPELICNVGFGC